MQVIATPDGDALVQGTETTTAAGGRKGTGDQGGRGVSTGKRGGVTRGPLTEVGGGDPGREKGTGQGPGIGVTTGQGQGIEVATGQGPGIGVATGQGPGIGVATGQGQGTDVAGRGPGIGVVTGQSPGIGVTTGQNEGQGKSLIISSHSSSMPSACGLIQDGDFFLDRQHE